MVKYKHLIVIGIVGIVLITLAQIPAGVEDQVYYRYRYSAMPTDAAQTYALAIMWKNMLLTPGIMSIVVAPIGAMIKSIVESH